MTDDLEQWLRTEATYQYAEDRIKQLEHALLSVASANSGRDRFSAEIDKIVFSALKDDKHG